MTATQSVNLPGQLVWDLWKLAEEHNVTVAEVIRTAITPTRPVKMTRPQKTRETHARIIAYVEAGLDDGAISVKIDRTRGYVADVRRRNNMKPNKRKATA